MHWRNPSTWQPGEKHDSWPNLEVILLYIFLRFWWRWIISYITNLLGSIFLMPMQRNAQDWYYYSFYHLQYLWWSLPVRIQINKEKQIQTTHSWSYQCFKNKDFSLYQKKTAWKESGEKNTTVFEAVSRCIARGELHFHSRKTQLYIYFP